MLDILTRAAYLTGWPRHLGPASGSDPKIRDAMGRYVLTPTYGANLGATEVARQGLNREVGANGGPCRLRTEPVHTGYTRTANRAAGHDRMGGGDRSVGWFKRSSRQQGSAEHVEQDVHAASTIKVGMASSVVLDRLGPPTSSMTSQEFYAKYEKYETVIMVGNKPLPDKEYWLYKDTPQGHSTEIVINGGVVESAVVRPAPAAR